MQKVVFNFFNESRISFMLAKPGSYQVVAVVEVTRVVGNEQLKRQKRSTTLRHLAGTGEVSISTTLCAMYIVIKVDRSCKCSLNGR